MSDIDLFSGNTDELVFSGPDGEPFTTSLVIANETGVQHQNLRELIEGSSADFEEFGVLRFETGKPLGSANGGGRPTKYALLNEPQATLLLTYMRNSDVVRAFKKRLVHSFYAMRTAIADRAVVKPLTPLEYARRLVDAEERAELGAQFKRAIEAGDGITLTAFHKKYFSGVREIDFFTHLYVKKWLINQRGKGSLRTSGPRAGTRRDGSEHRHPTFKGKPYLYLHCSKDHGDHRRENTRVRPGEWELQLRDRLIGEGMTGNENTAGLFELETAR